VQGDLPHLPGLLASHLLPIPKPSGGVWPTAISEVRYRLAALCALAACPDGLKPLQVGVGVSGSSQVVRHALRIGIAAEAGCVSVQIDWKNACNTPCRDQMLMAVETRCPALLPLVASAYRQPSRLYVCGSDNVVVSSQSGVFQGDPLGPLLFALTLQNPLEKVVAM
jgi:hypothetical protein